jgi:hypothetical protein
MTPQARTPSGAGGTEPAHAARLRSHTPQRRLTRCTPANNCLEVTGSLSVEDGRGEDVVDNDEAQPEPGAPGGVQVGKERLVLLVGLERVVDRGEVLYDTIGRTPLRRTSNSATPSSPPPAGTATVPRRRTTTVEIPPDRGPRGPSPTTARLVGLGRSPVSRSSMRVPPMGRRLGAIPVRIRVRSRATRCRPGGERLLPPDGVVAQNPRMSAFRRVTGAGAR